MCPLGIPQCVPSTPQHQATHSTPSPSTRPQKRPQRIPIMRPHVDGPVRLFRPSVAFQLTRIDSYRVRPRSTKLPGTIFLLSPCSYIVPRPLECIFSLRLSYSVRSLPFPRSRSLLHISLPFALWPHITRLSNALRRVIARPSRTRRSHRLNGSSTLLTRRGRRSVSSSRMQAVRRQRSQPGSGRARIARAARTPRPRLPTQTDGQTT